MLANSRTQNRPGQLKYQIFLHSNDKCPRVSANYLPQDISTPPTPGYHIHPADIIIYSPEENGRSLKINRVIILKMHFNQPKKKNEMRRKWGAKHSFAQLAISAA